MISENIPMGIFFFQTAMGILGNFLLLFHYLLTVLNGKSLVTKDLIVKHLMLANSLALFTIGIPRVMIEVGFQYLLDDVACKLIVYLYRVARGTSMQTTCLLSCFQAITISSSSNIRWMKLKHRASKYVGHSCLITWLLHMILNNRILIRVASLDNSNDTNLFNFGYCSGFVPDTIASSLYFLILSFADGVCLGLMAWASVSMVTILLRHKRQVQYIHSAHHSPGLSPEARATQTILILVCTFVSLYSLSSTLVILIALVGSPKSWTIHFLAFVEMSFPTFSPFILISSNKYDCSFYFSCWGKR